MCEERMLQFWDLRSQCFEVSVVGDCCQECQSLFEVKILIKLYNFSQNLITTKQNTQSTPWKTNQDYIFLLRLHQYIDVPCANDPLEDVGGDSRVQQVMEYVMQHLITCVFVSKCCGGIDLLCKMMYACIMMRYRAKVLS